jgi:hypothetical protein
LLAEPLHWIASAFAEASADAVAEPVIGRPWLTSPLAHQNNNLARSDNTFKFKISPD